MQFNDNLEAYFREKSHRRAVSIFNFIVGEEREIKKFAAQFDKVNTSMAIMIIQTNNDI